MSKAIVIFSGGMDSATALWWALKQGYDVTSMTFDYGQRHKKEIEATWAIRNYAYAKTMEHWRTHVVVPMTGVSAACMSGGSQTGSEPVPHGHYTDESMKVTVVPNRNMIFLALATGRAVMEKAERVIYGAHAGDHAIYADCRPEFVNSMRQVIRVATYEAQSSKQFGQLQYAPPFTVDLEAPFIDKTKAAVAVIGGELGVPFALTWSCYEGKDFHCGKCGTCVERREAFRLARIEDPTNYEMS